MALLSNCGITRALSIYVHVPFCAQPRNKIVTRDPAHADQYLQRLQREIELQGALFDRRRSVRQLIYGLPLQTVTSLGATVDTALRMRPDRIAAYGYAHMPHLFKAQRAIRAEQLPDAQTRVQLLALIVERLTDAGYVYIGMDHFALPDDDLARALRDGSLHRNSQGYSTHGDCALIGLGVSAIGAVGDSYSQNCKHLSGYDPARSRSAARGARHLAERGRRTAPGNHSTPDV